MFRLLAFVLLSGSGCTGWWSKSSVPEPEGPWKAWAREHVPTAVSRFDQLAEAYQSVRETLSGWGGYPVDWGIWSIFDGLVGLAGWGLFGSVWGDVKTGCRRLIQIVIVLTLCVVAHYVWAICWPIVSLVIAIVMTFIWVVRKVVRVAGRVMFHLQRACGGTPEALDAEYYGPGTGSVPETSELRKFKYLSSQEKWVVVRRGSEVAVFKVSPDAQTIRSSGLYVGIEPDTLRGTASLLRDLQGHDKLHLCRNESCPEDGQHFKSYGLARKYDPEKFELALAAQGAKDAGGLLWKWGVEGLTGRQREVGRLWL